MAQKTGAAMAHRPVAVSSAVDYSMDMVSEAIGKGKLGLDSGSVGHMHKAPCCVQSPIPQEKKEKEKGDKLDMVAHTCNPSTEVDESGEAS